MSEIIVKADFVDPFVVGRRGAGFPAGRTSLADVGSTVFGRGLRQRGAKFSYDCDACDVID